MSFKLKYVFSTLAALFLVATPSLVTGSGQRLEEREIVFIDPSIPQAEVLAAAATPGAEVVLLDAKGNELAQVAAHLAQRKNIRALHFVTHGAPGTLVLGQRRIDAALLQSQPNEVAAWKNALSADAEIYFYGCAIASGAEGTHFLNLVEEHTGAHCLASDDATGAANLGGDWELEYGQLSPAATASIFDSGKVSAWQHVLGTITTTAGVDTPLPWIGTSSPMESVVLYTPGQIIFDIVGIPAAPAQLSYGPGWGYGSGSLVTAPDTSGFGNAYVWGAGLTDPTTYLYFKSSTPGTYTFKMQYYSDIEAKVGGPVTVTVIVNPAGSAPTITTPTNASVTSSSATLGGNVTADGGSAITERGVVYSSINNNPQIGGSNVTKVTATGTTGVFTTGVSGLSSSTLYYFKAYATNGAGTAYTSVSSFTTSAPAAPEMALLGNSTVIADEDGTPSAADHTDFGSTAVAGGTVVRTFTVSNSGSGVLNLTGTPRVVVSGTNAADFTVTTQPSTPVAATNGTTTFQVTFDPSAAGLRTASLSIANNDTDENPYNFSIQGTGTAPEIVVEQPTNTSLTDGSASISFGSQAVGSTGSPLTFTIRNTGTSNLEISGISKNGTNSLDFDISGPAGTTIAPSSSTTFEVTFSPISAGARNAAIHIANNDADEASFDIALTGTGTVSNNANLSSLVLSTGTLAPAFASGTTSYTATVPYATTSLTLTGAVAQANASLTINGNAAISGNPSGPLSLNVGANTLTTAVTAQDGVTIRTYTVVVTRESPAPEIAIEQPLNTGLTDSGASVSFGSQAVGTSGTPLTFTIRNSGTANLVLSSISKDGVNALDFDIADPLITTISPGGSTTFEVTFSPIGAGSRGAAIHIASNDSDEASFDINLTGTGTVSNNANLSSLALSMGTLSPAFATGTTSYTATVPNSVSSLTLTATVDQPNASLTINGNTAISANPSGALSLNVGATTLTTVVTAQDGSTTRIYTVVVTREPPPPGEIAVEQPAGADLTDGSASIDLGSQTVTLAGSPMTFTIRNSGGSDLTLGAFTKDGASAADFTISAPGLTTLPPAGSTTFTVTFTPGGAGVRNAALHIASNDTDENPFDIALTGTGVSAGIIDIDSAATISVFEEAGTVDIPLVRTGGSTGAISVKISTVNGTAKAPGDFTALTNYTVDFADGETSKTVPITIIADSLATEINEFFSVQLSGPAGGATLGTTTTATVRIVEPDLVIPTVSIVAPGANANVAEGAVNLNGTVTDAKGLAKAEYSLNGGPWQPLTVTLNATGQTGTFSTPITPEIGANTIKVRGYDFRDNISNELTRPFKYVVMRPLDLTINPAIGGTVTFTPPLVSGKAQVGTSYTLKATAKPGYLWDTWTAPGVSGAAADAATLVVTMTEGLAITADFVKNSMLSGTYTGLATPQSGVTPGVENFGLFSGTLASTGVFTGRVNFGGNIHVLTPKFDASTMLASGTLGDISYDLALDSTTKKITGTLTIVSSGDVCDVDADLAVFSAASPVPAELLNGTTGIYTVVFAAQEQTPARAHSEYPQGDGFGKVTLFAAGTTSFTGTLADGTTFTLSVPLSKDYRLPLAAFIKASATVPGTTLGGMVQLDVSQPDSDLYAADMRWFRTPFATAANYSAGWPGGITVETVGALYASTTNVQTTLQLDVPHATDGNAKLVFTEGKLTSSITKTNFNINASAVTKLPATDPSFTLAPAAGTGTFSGSFVPNWSNPATAKPTYKGTFLQKGANRGGYGFFISNAAGDTAPESGRVFIGPP